MKKVMKIGAWVIGGFIALGIIGNIFGGKGSNSESQSQTVVANGDNESVEEDNSQSEEQRKREKAELEAKLDAEYEAHVAELEAEIKAEREAKEAGREAQREAEREAQMSAQREAEREAQMSAQREAEREADAQRKMTDETWRQITGNWKAIKNNQGYYLQIQSDGTARLGVGDLSGFRQWTNSGACMVHGRDLTFMFDGKGYAGTLCDKYGGSTAKYITSPYIKMGDMSFNPMD